MEINEKSLSVFYLSKFLALAPFSLKRNKKGDIEIKRSKFFTLYSIGLCMAIVIVMISGFGEYYFGPLRKHSAPIKMVFALDVSIIILTLVGGVGCSLLSIQPTQELNSRLRKIDAFLHLFPSHKNDHTITKILATLPIILTIGIFGCSCYLWMRYPLADFDRKHILKTAYHFYVPFYVSHLVIIALHIMYGNNALVLGGRFHRLNTILKYNFLYGKRYIPITWLINPGLGGGNELNTDAICKVSLLRSLADIYLSLSKCVDIFSNTFGFGLICGFTLCLVQLVLTSHFLILFITRAIWDFRIFNELMWLSIHLFRLLIIVESCHKAAAESKKAVEIIYEIRRKFDDPSLVEELEKFSHVLRAFEVKFSVMAAFNIDRNILTTICSAIATYLIMVTQFKNFKN